MAPLTGVRRIESEPEHPGRWAAASLSAADVDSAAKRIAGVVTPTPLQLSDRLSATTGASVYLKREDLQTVRSYKLRGAYNLLVQLSPEELAAGVVCSSAGNHAQGFAFACRTLGVRGRVYVPAKTPKQKRDRIRYHGGEFIELIVGGSTYDLAAEAALADVARTGATLVPPFDDPRTMAGQGTIAVEILDQLDGSRIWWWFPSVAADALPASPPTLPSGRGKPPCWVSSRQARRR